MLDQKPENTGEMKPADSFAHESRASRGFIGSRSGLSGSTLKLIACFTMLIDHTGAAVVWTLLQQPAIRRNVTEYNRILSTYNVMRQIGRLAFPIFCFLIVEGFFHTHDVRKYMKRLFLFALISEFPFDFALKTEWFFPRKQNVYFTLLIGLLVIFLMSQFRSRRIMQLTIFLAGMLFARGLMTDYSYKGVFLITILYIFHDDRLLQCFAGAASIAWETTAPPAFILCYLYNGKRGLRLKYFFYLFYPVHLTILGILKWFVIPNIAWR